MRLRRRAVTLCTISAVSLTLLAGVPAATAEDPPGLRLFAASSRVEIERDRRGFAWLDPGVWVAAVGGAFELRVSRPDYDTPVSVVQTDAATGEALRTLPVELLDGWSGMRDFLHLSVRDSDGRVVLRQRFTFCPNNYVRARLNDDGPLNSSYPYFCGGNPFTRGTVWGIDADWAVSPLADAGFGFDARRNRYELRAWIDPAWVEALGIEQPAAEARVAISVSDGGRMDGPGVAAPFSRGARVPTVTSPAAEGLPDLIALPAWGVATYHRRGRDLLAFNATEWNAGPGTLVVEGFRGPDQELMDAFQYFLVDGRAVGRAPIGQMEFHPQHHHWHFQQFTEYSLLDADSGEVAISGKQSWCLANTDAIDLAVPNANWAGYGGDLFTMCGGPGALWIREVLDVGWGDTYSQYIAGQAFDVTDLPNGDYYIRVHVNPTGSMLEGSPDNNIEDRLIQLRGKPGARRVVVPPWHGIDTEGGCYFCG
ncbi:MAG: lysyl oxidase family protein [Actinomycetota bacterium]